MIEFTAISGPQAVTQWAERISAAVQSSLTGILQAGQLLVEAKAALPHGDFAAMIESSLPFSARTAQRFMAISSDRRLTNATHASLLPPAWGTLYELTKLPDDVFQQKIADGTIRPDMQRKDIVQKRAKAPETIEHIPTIPTRGRAAICLRVREAITALSGLPSPAEVVGYLNGTDDGMLIDERLPAAARWLAEFSNLWPEEETHVEAAE